MPPLSGLLLAIIMTFGGMPAAFGQDGASFADPPTGEALDSESAATAEDPVDIGVVALVNPDATLERAATETTVTVGQDIALQDKLITDRAGQVHLMLVDKSAFTVGPNSEITVDRFVYDPDTRTGDMALSAARGVMRFVGGELSKNNPVEIETSIGLLGIRGGILLLRFSEGGGFTAIFGFGTDLTFTGLTGEVTSLVVRPGFMIQVGAGGDVTGPIPAPQDVIDGILADLEGQGPGGDTGDPGETNPIPENAPEVIDALLEAGLTGVGEGPDGTLLFEFNEDLVDTEELISLTEDLVDLGDDPAAAIEFLLTFSPQVITGFTGPRDVTLTGVYNESFTVPPGGVTKTITASGAGTINIDPASIPPGGSFTEVTSPSPDVTGAAQFDCGPGATVTVNADGSATITDDGTGGC